MRPPPRGRSPSPPSATTTPRATGAPRARRTRTSAASPSIGDPATAWYTERYRISPDFGGLKTGVGLILRLTGPAVATQMVVTSPTPGAGFQVLGPLEAGRREVLASGVFSGAEQVVPITSAAPAEAYVLWITSLVADGTGGYWAGVGQVELRGVPNST